MLRKFKIKIDGKEYLVEMEELGDVPQPVAPAPAAPVPAAPVSPTPAAAPAPQPAAPEAVTPTPAAAPGSGQVLDAPMPGTILKVLVAIGDEVKENQPVMILEAMKMENEIVAPKDGIVTGIMTQQGAVINAGDPLISIE